MNNLEQAIEIHRKSFERNESRVEGALITLKDPFSGNILRPDGPPRSIEQTAELNKGLDYLRANSSRFRLTVYTAPHGDSALHDNDDITAAFADHDVLFFEGLQHYSADNQLLSDIATLKKAQITDEEARRLGEYKVRVLAMLLGANKPAFYADVASDRSNLESAIISWGELSLNLQNSINNSLGDVNASKLALGISLAGSSIFREWCMLASMGICLQDLEESGETPKNLMFLVGSLHGKTLPKKARYLGVDTVVQNAKMIDRGEANPLSLPFDLARAIGDCVIESIEN